MSNKRYFFEFCAVIALYALVLAVSLRLLQGERITEPAIRAAVSLLPMLPAGLVLWAVLRQLRRIDELQRRIQFEAIGVAFAATALVTFSYGFLENVGFPRLSAFAVWPLMCGIWGLSVALVSWRYR